MLVRDFLIIGGIVCFVHFEIDGRQNSIQLYTARVWDTRLEFGQCCVFVEIREIFTQKRRCAYARLPRIKCNSLRREVLFFAFQRQLPLGFWS